MKRIYIGIAVLGASFILSKTIYILESSNAVKLTLDVNSTESMALEPEVATIVFERIDDFASSAEEIKNNNFRIGRDFSSAIKNKFVATRIFSTVQQSTYKSKQKIAVSYNGISTITVHIKAIDQIPKIIETAIAMGINQIGETQFSITDEKEVEIRKQLKKKAFARIYDEANSLARALKLKTAKLGDRITVTIPPAEPMLGGGMSSSEISDIIEPLSESFEVDLRQATTELKSFLAKIKDFVIPEPEFKGTVVAPMKLQLSAILISETVTLPFDFSN